MKWRTLPFAIFAVVSFADWIPFSAFLLGGLLVLVWRLASQTDARFYKDTPRGILDLSKSVTSKRILYAYEKNLQQYEVDSDTLEQLPDAVQEFVTLNVNKIKAARDRLLDQT